VCVCGGGGALDALEYMTSFRLKKTAFQIKNILSHKSTKQMKVMTHLLDQTQSACCNQSNLSYNLQPLQSEYHHLDNKNGQGNVLSVKRKMA
jgi:hypothetical protein